MTLKTSRESLSADLFDHKNKRLKTIYKFDCLPYAKIQPLTLMKPKSTATVSDASDTSGTSDTSDDLADDLISRLEELVIDKPIKHEEDSPSKIRKFTKKRLDIIASDDDSSALDEIYTQIISTPKKVEIAPLTEDEDALVTRTLCKGQRGVVAQYKNATVEFKDIYKLYPETWLNDEIINFYMALLSDRADSDDQLPKIHCFSTFFCSTLREQGYNKVRRWTKRVDIFSKDLLLIPINRSYHWVLGAIDMNEKCIRVYDSLGGNHDATLGLFLDYLDEEHKDKKKSKLDLEGWTTESPKDIPQQGNMSDCGVFTCTFAERLARRCIFDFSQDDMVLLRRRMVLNILNKKI